MIFRLFLYKCNEKRNKRQVIYILSVDNNLKFENKKYYRKESILTHLNDSQSGTERFQAITNLFQRTEPDL